MAETSQTASSSRAILRETEGLAACLERDRAEVLRWKDENPLRLVAAALVDVPRRPAKRADIGAKLTPEIISPDEWERWWSRIQPTMKSSRHFSQDARHAIRLRAKPSEIEPASRSEPAVVASAPRAQDDKPRAAPSRSSALRLVDWINWAQSDDDASAPRGVPPDGLAAYLRQQPAVLIPTSISKLSGAIKEKILDAASSSRPSPDAWIDLLAISLDRCAESPADRRAPMSETVEFCARLTAELGTGACRGITESLAKWTSASAENVKVMANAILTSASAAPRETASLLQNLHDSLSESNRKALWMRLITSDAGQVSEWLIGRWMRIMRDAEKSDMVSALLPFSRESDYISNLNSMLNGELNTARNGAAPAHMFNPILMSWFLHRDMMPRAVKILKGRIQELREENGRLRAEHQSEIAEKDRLIGVAESETERVDKGKTYFQEKLRESASSISLRFNRDAIVMLGEWFRDLSESPLPSHPETMGVQEKIEVALLALGAEPFGQVGELVPFDLISHEAEPPPPQGSLVKIIAPGVAHVRDEYTPRMMVKAKVNVEKRA